MRISTGVREFLTNLFSKGTKDLYQKAMPADVVEQIKKNLPLSGCVEVQTVRGYFSLLALQKKGVAEQEIGLRHPLVYDDFNFCDLSTKGRLAKVLQKQKISQLQSF